jgi:hypothetical protein
MQGRIQSEHILKFYKSPIGIRFDLKESDNYTTDICVGEILQKNESTEKIQEGWILKKINEIDITQYSLKQVYEILSNKMRLASPSTPVLLTFLNPTDAAPLFNPFIEKKRDSQSIYVSDQKVAMGNSVAIREAITTLPSAEGSAAVSPSMPEITATMLVNTNDVINVNDLRKRIINIDSEFRDNFIQDPSDFSFKIVPPIKNAIRIRMASIEMNNTFYIFSTLKQNISLRLICPIAGTDYTFTISPGNYSATGLVKAIQDQFNVAGIVPRYTVSLDTITGKITITNTTSVLFIMDFRTDSNKCKLQHWGLAYYLGFRMKYYSDAISYTTESIIDVIVDQYIFLQVNDYANVEQHLKSGDKFTAFAKLILKDGKFTKVFDNTSNFLTKEIIFSQPTDINTLNLRLVDRYGDTIRNLDSEWSVAFEITDVMNGRLYDFYRNYLFRQSGTNL